MKIKQNNQVVSRYIKGRLYVFDENASLLHTYNEVGSFIWSLAKKPIEIEKIIQIVIDKFDVSETISTRDVTDFIRKESKKNGLFVRIA